MMEVEDDPIDPYELLNVSPEASFKEVKERYFQLSRVFHPDKQAAHLYKEARKQFEQIDRAYKAISNAFLKLIYDNFGFVGTHARSHFPHPPPPPPNRYQAAQPAPKQVH